MKKIVLSLVAASLVATPALAAAPQRHDAPRHQTVVKHKPNGAIVTRTSYRPAAQQQRNWRKGERFDSRYARNYRQVDYRQYRGLKAPPRGYHYVQSGNDAVLVSLAGGIIGAVFANMLR